jgi:plastocyanin
MCGAAIVTLSVYACSSDSGTGSGNDAGSDAASEGGGGDGGGGETSTASPVKCTQPEFDANDHTAGAVPDVVFPSDSNPVQYAPNCLKVKKGATVTWKGSFQNHPLQAAGGESSTPITLTNSSTAKSFTFAATGSFGYECMFHPALMFGAVQVVP